MLGTRQSNCKSLWSRADTLSFLLHGRGETQAGSSASCPCTGLSLVVQWSMRLGRFSKKPRKGIKKKKVRLVHVLNLVFGIYENKIVADAADDAVQQAAGSVLTQRQNMPDYVYEDLLNKFGLASYVRRRR